MKFLDWLTGRVRVEERKRDSYLQAFMGSRGVVGQASAETVLSNSAVATRCVALRSELLASVPLFLFKRTPDGGRERADMDPLYECLHDAPNGVMTAFELRELLIRSLDLFGNAYARIERNGRGQVVSLWPLSARDVEVQRLSNGRLKYKHSDPGGGTTVYLMEDILHLRGPSKDGIMGQSPISIARGALSLTMAQHETASSMTENGFRAPFVVMHPAKLGPQATKNIEASMTSTHAGPRNAGKALVLEEGMRLEKVAFSSEDSEFLSSRKLSNEDVARIFGVPPTAAGIMDKSTYSNTEQEAGSLIQNCLGPLAARLESGLQRCLLTANGRRSMYIEHDLSGLLRGDVAARFNAYRLAREMGVFSANDVRRRENESPIENGDTYNQPANWVPLGSQPQSGGEVERVIR